MDIATNSTADTRQTTAFLPSDLTAQEAVLEVVDKHRAELWIEGMVADGFAFEVIRGGDPANPADYSIHKQGIDRSSDLIAALRGRWATRAQA